MSFVENCDRELRRKIATKNCGEELRRRIATKNCGEELRRRIATKNCCMFHNMKYIFFVFIDDFDVCFDKFSFVIDIVKISNDDVLCDYELCVDILRDDV